MSTGNPMRLDKVFSRGNTPLGLRRGTLLSAASTSRIFMVHLLAADDFSTTTAWVYDLGRFRFHALESSGVQSSLGSALQTDCSKWLGDVPIAVVSCANPVRPFAGRLSRRMLHSVGDSSGASCVRRTYSRPWLAGHPESTFGFAERCKTRRGRCAAIPRPSEQDPIPATSRIVVFLGVVGADFSPEP